MFLALVVFLSEVRWNQIREFFFPFKLSALHSFSGWRGESGRGIPYTMNNHPNTAWFWTVWGNCSTWRKTDVGRTCKFHQTNHHDWWSVWWNLTRVNVLTLRQGQYRIVHHVTSGVTFLQGIKDVSFSFLSQEYCLKHFLVEKLALWAQTVTPRGHVTVCRMASTVPA